MDTWKLQETSGMYKSTAIVPHWSFLLHKMEHSANSRIRRFGSMDHIEAQKYRGQIVMNTEDELFFPTLTVGQTIDFATRMKVPYHLPSNKETPAELQVDTRDFLLNSMGIQHTHDTKVGNEFVRGVSGGERKRVSIIECLATRGSVYCWDNSTRGLDASMYNHYLLISCLIVLLYVAMLTII